MMKKGSRDPAETKVQPDLKQQDVFTRTNNKRVIFPPNTVISYRKIGWELKIGNEKRF